ncbi:TetR/AcrR family transcriptional regulator [Actinoallomurus iriomotensis]|uniref:TetR family transcriptional regulator n=1 Tax=Actinoallomurus iriomotensis TaxID=478107 RepID=A0A9W6VQP5_9ACTN|nr:TetR/AcrR family transcriptional regulator [Actinoallomurus iriomotensis]GLY76119.1 TetR family transcriptional regulator [Actinoallomurus iriomotensis]
MAEELSLRERKKRETRQRIADVAMGLFMLRGFEKVTVAEVAEAADVSVNTVFNYFRTKEDLFFDRQDVVVENMGRIVAARPPGQSAIDALRRDLLASIDARDWRYGINGGASDFFKMVAESPALANRIRQLHEQREEYLARVLAEETDADPDDPTPRLVAAQLAALTRAVGTEFLRRRLAGESVETILPSVRAAAERAFHLLESGVGAYAVKPA